MKLLPLTGELEEYIKTRDLERKWRKAKKLFEQNRSHPSLNTELLEPKARGIYSFRLDRKYRVLFFFTPYGAAVFDINNHYK